MTRLLRAALLLFSTPVFVSLAHGQCIEQKLLPSDGALTDAFGTSVDVFGTTAVVGAPNKDSGGLFNTGAAYVFENNGSGWVEVAKLVAFDMGQNDRFGKSVAIHGNVIVVGAPENSAGRGAVYVFEDNGSGWQFTTKVVPPAQPLGPFLGTSVDVLTGPGLSPTFVVGAVGDDTLGMGAGAIYLFSRVSATSWVQVWKRVAFDGAPGQTYGFSVAIGVPGPSSSSSIGPILSGAVSAGNEAVYVYQPNGNFSTKLVSGVTTQSDFGWSVDVEGDRIAVGAPSGRGWVHVFDRTPTAWVGTKFQPSDGAEVIGKHFGWDVGLEGDLLIAGAPNDDGEVFSSIGAAYTYTLVGTTWQLANKVFANGVPHAAEFGTAVAINGGPAIVGAPRDGSTGSAHVLEPFAPSGSCVVGTEFCFCDSGAPCGNTDPSAGCANSTGSGAFAQAFGSTSVAADNLTLKATGIPGTHSGRFFMGAGTTSVPFDDGIRCVVSGGGSGTYRYALRSAVSGTITEGPGVVGTSLTRFAPAGQIAVGQTWNFQCWYRDAPGPCNQGTNLSNAVALTFTP